MCLALEDDLSFDPLAEVKTITHVSNWMRRTADMEKKNMFEKIIKIMSESYKIIPSCF